MFEKRVDRILPRSQFVLRMAWFTGVAMVLILFALLLGVAGYHWIAGFSVVDALLNASMILTGMGPVGSLPTVGAKLFASAYAIFSGLVFITVMGVILSPVVHRILHKFHMEEEAEAGDPHAKG